MSRPPRRLAPLLVLPALALGVACAGSIGTALLEGAFGAIKKHFLGVATSNYGDAYKDDFDKVLSALTSVAKDKVAAVGKEEPAPAGTTPAPAGTTPPPAGTPPPANGTAPVAATPPAGTAPAPAGTTPAPVAPVAGVPGAPGTPGAFELEFVLLKEEVIDGRSVPTPVSDGDVVYDRFGSHGEGDNLKLRFRATSECWVYVISVDSTAWVKPLFPSSYAAVTNPIKPNTTVELPPGNNWATLDSYRGTEHVFVVASRTQRLDLEQALTQLAANVRDIDPARELEKKERVEVIAQAGSVSRGWDTARPSQFAGVQNSQGQPFNVDTQIYSARSSGEFVLTRWFRHQ